MIFCIFSPGGFTRSGVTNVIRRSNKKCYHFFSLFLRFFYDFFYDFFTIFARKSPVYTPVKLPIFAYFCKKYLVYTPVKTQQKLFSFLPAKLEYTYSLLLDKRSFRTRYMNLLLFSVVTPHNRGSNSLTDSEIKSVTKGKANPVSKSVLSLPSTLSVPILIESTVKSTCTH